MESYSVQATLSAVDKNLSSTFGKAAQAASDFESKSKQSLENVGKFMTVAGAAVTAIGIKSVKSFGDFQSSLNKAAVIAGGTSKDIQGLADVANHMGAVLPLSAQDAADAMVAMARDGASISTIKKEFPAIAEAATAAGADLQTTASVVQQSMNIWGDSLKSPQRAAAILTQTANLSNASIEDMQQALATIGGTASNAGIDMETTSTAIGLLTNKGFSAAQASQDLNHALLLMQAPSKMGKAVMDDLGVSMTDAQGNMKPLPTILNELSDSMSNMTSTEKAAALKKMFGTSGMAAILPLMKSVKDTTGNATTSWSAFTDQMNKASSSTQTATKFLQQQASEMQKNLGSSIEQVGGNWEALRNAAMAGSAGVIGSIIDMINNALEWATTTKSAFGNSIRTIMGLTPVIGAATLATGTFLTAATKIGSVMSTVGTALKALFISPIGLAIVALSALVAAFAYAYKTSAFFRRTISDIGNSISKTFGPALQNVISSIKSFVSQGTSLFSGFGDKVADSLQGAMVNINFKAIANGFVNVFNQIMNVVAMVKNSVIDLISAFVKTGAISAVWNAVLSMIKAVYNVISSVIIVVGNLIGSFTSVGTSASVFTTIGTVIGNIVTVIANVITYISNLVTAILSINGARDVITALAVGIGGIAIAFKVVTAAITLGQAIFSTFTTIINVAKTAMLAFNVALSANPISLLVIAITAVTAALVYFFTQTQTGQSIWQGFMTYLSSAWTAMSSFLIGIWNTLGSVFSTIWQALVPVIQNLVSMLQSIWTGYVTAATTVWNGLVSIASGVWNLLKSVILGPILLLIDLLTGNWSQMKKDAVMIWNNIKSSLGQIVSGIVTAVSGYFKGLGQMLSGIWNSVRSAASSIWNAISSTLRNLANSAINGVKGAWSGITGWASSVWNGVKSAIRAAMNFSLFGAGSAIMNGFLDGLRSVWGAITSFVGGIASWIRQHKGPIQYDRKLLIPAGNAIMNGLNAGLVDNFKTVQKNVSGMAGSILDAATSVGNLATNAIGDPINALNNNIGGSYSSVMTLDHTSTTQPANITIGFDKHGYTAYVDDINNQQGKTALLKRNNSVQL